MNNLSKFLLGAASVALLGAVGCNKLDEKPYDFYAPGNVYSTAADAEAAIAGVYTDLNSYDFMVKPYWEWLSEDDDVVAGPSWALSNIGAGNYQGDYKTPRMYTGPYVMISRANSVLENVPQIDMDEAQKNRILGEAHFLRAWSYFVLVRLFGPVPLRTTTIKDIAEANVPRAPIADVYKQIIDDLQQGEDLMPYQDGAGAGALGHANKGAAQALLTKVYATIGSAALAGAQLTVRGGADNAPHTYAKAVVPGYESFDSRAYYQLAKAEAAKLIASGKYSLFPNYMDLWQKANDNLVEHIFMAQTLPGSIQHTNFVSRYFTVGSLGGGGYLWMSTDFYRQYSPYDDRVQKSITHFWFDAFDPAKPLERSYHYFPREDSAKYHIVSINTKTGEAPQKGDTTYATFDNKAYSLKYYVPGKPVTPNNPESPDAINYPLLRYADVLLLYAEAENELNGNTADARQYYLQVRQRSNPNVTAAQDPLLNPAGLTQLEMRSAIFAERGQELYFESDRRYDLNRWGVFLPVMNAIGVSNQNVIKTRTDRSLLLPLPQNEVLSSPQIKQNPGW